MLLSRKIVSRVLCAALSCASIYSVSASQVAVTDDFNFGSWSPFLSRWQKNVPVCVWDSTGAQSLFRVEAAGVVSNNQFKLQSDIGESVPYRLHWRDGANTNHREKLYPNIASNRIYQGYDAARCASGPTGLLQLTIDSESLSNAAPGVYADTIVLTITPL